MVAREFGQDPFEIQGRWSERQLQIALTWIKEDFNHPGKSEWYAMRTSATVRGLFERCDVEDFKLSFKDKKPLSKEELESTDGPPIITKETIEDFNKQVALLRSGASSEASAKLRKMQK